MLFWPSIILACCALPQVYAITVTLWSPTIDQTPTPTLPCCQEASSIVSCFTQPAYTSAACSYCSSMLNMSAVTVTAFETETAYTTEYDATYVDWVSLSREKDY